MRWRYVVLGLGFLGLAGVRAAEGAPVWAVVFVIAAVVNAWLAAHEAPQAAPSAPADVDAPDSRDQPSRLNRLDRSDVDRSLAGYRTSARQWQFLGGAGVLVGGGLLLLEPALAVFAGAAAIFALHRARRAGRAVATLQRVPVMGR